MELLLKWVTLGVGLMQMALSGSLYNFGIYSKVLKRKLGFSQTDINLVPASGEIGLYVSGAPVGAFYDHFGPQWASALSAVLLFGSYFGVYLMLEGHIASNIGVLCLMYVFLGQGSHMSYVTSLVTNLKNFAAKRRGLIVGVMVSMFGLSATILSLIYHHQFKPSDNIEGFLLMCAIAMAAVNVLAVLFVRVDPVAQRRLRQAERAGEEERALATAISEDEEQEGEALALDDKPLEEGVYGWRILRTKDFWLLFAVFGLGAGSGLMFINSIGSLVASLRGDNEDTIVELMGGVNALSRLAWGYITDRYRGVSRASYMAVCCFIMSAGSFVLAVSPLALLPLPTILIGTAYGGLFSIAPSLVSNLWSVEHLGQHWGWLTPSAGSASVIFGVISGKIYDAQTKAGSNKCFGRSCWAYSFLMTGTLSAVAGGIALYFARHLRKKSDARYHSNTLPFKATKYSDSEGAAKAE